MFCKANSYCCDFDKRGTNSVVGQKYCIREQSIGDYNGVIVVQAECSRCWAVDWQGLYHGGQHGDSLVFWSNDGVLCEIILIEGKRK